MKVFLFLFFIVTVSCGESEKNSKNTEKNLKRSEKNYKNPEKNLKRCSRIINDYCLEECESSGFEKTTPFSSVVVSNEQQKMECYTRCLKVLRNPNDSKYQSFEKNLIANFTKPSCLSK